MKTFYEQTIIDSIDLEGYEVSENCTLFNKIKFVYLTFKSEYVHDNNKFINKQILFKDWLQGLPSVLTVPFMNYIILENAKKAGFTFETEQQEERFLDTYWGRLSNAFFTLKENL